jgi:hypothetical protein
LLRIDSKQQEHVNEEVGVKLCRFLTEY